MVLPLLCGLALQQESRIAFSAPAQKLESLCLALSQKLNLNLSVDGKLANEVVLVEVKAATQTEILGRIAAVTGGAWESLNTGLKLTLSQSAERKQRAAEMLDRADQVREAIDRNQAAQAKMSLEQFRTALKSGKARRPADQLETFISTLGDDALGGLRPGQRAVLCGSPNAMQYGLTPNQLNALNLIKLSVPTVQGQLPPAAAAPNRYVILSRPFGYPGVQAKVHSVLPNGKVYGQAAGFYALDSFTERPALKGWELPTTPLKLDPVAVLMAPNTNENSLAMLSSGSNGMWDEEDRTAYSSDDLSVSPNPEVLKRILAADTEEPLDWAVGHPLRHVAATDAADLVACLPDASLAPSVRAASKPTDTVKSYVDAMVRDNSLTFERTGTWLLVRPRYSATTRDVRLDRRILGTTLKAFSIRGALSLAEQMDESAQPMAAPTENFEAMFGLLVNPTFGTTLAKSVSSGERLVLRVLQRLGGEMALQRAANWQTVDALPPAARSELQSYVFSEAALLRFNADRGGFNLDRPQSVSEERTFRWNNGLPPKLGFKLEVSSEDSFFGLGASGVKPKMSNSGWMTTIWGEGHKTATSVPRLANYTKGTWRTVRISLFETPEPCLTRRLHDVKIPAGAPRIAFSELPIEMQKNIESAETQIQKSLDEMRKGQGGGATPH